MDYFISEKYQIIHNKDVDYSNMSREELINRIKERKCNINFLAKNEKYFEFFKEMIPEYLDYFMKFPAFVRKFHREFYLEPRKIKEFISELEKENNIWLFIFYQSLYDFNCFKKTDFIKLNLFCYEMGKELDRQHYENFTEDQNFVMIGANYLWQNRFNNLEKKFSFFCKGKYRNRRIETLNECLEILEK